MYLYVCREYVYYLILPLYVFYQKRTTSGTMLSQTRNLYRLRNRQNTVRYQSYNFISYNNYNYFIYFVSDITVVCVLPEKDDIWHDALSDSQLVRASDLVEPGTFSFCYYV